MDQEMFRLMQERTPKLNPVLARGLATTQMPHVEEYIDGIIRAATQDTYEGLQYVGMSRCTPAEEYLVNSRRRSPLLQARKNPKRTIDMAPIDAIMVKLFFRFQGEDLEPRYIYLPFVGEGGTITINGSEFVISPVIADRVISVGTENIFVRLYCDRITFHRTATTFVANGVRETVQIVYSLIHHHQPDDEKPAIKSAHTCMAHYLFCKYGFTQTFKKYAGFEPIVATYFDPNQFTEDEWVICASSNAVPKGKGRIFGDVTKQQNIKLAIRRENYTPLVRGLVAGFFYVADRFPSHVVIDHLDSTRQWMTMMGYILFAASNGVGRLVEKMNNHINSLDEYADIITKAELEDIGIVIDNIYDFFAYIIANFDNLLLGGASKVNSMYDKSLNVLYYVMFDLIKNIFKFNFQLIPYSKKNAGEIESTRRNITVRDINSMLDKAFNPRIIHWIVKNHGEITSTSYSGDCMAFKITNQLVPQQNSTRTRGKGGDRGSINDPGRQLHVSVAEVGSYSGMSKSEPSGRSKLNLCLQLDHKFVIKRDDELRPLLDKVQDMITKK